MAHLRAVTAVVKMLAAAFPEWKVIPTTQDNPGTVGLWSACFGDASDAELQAAVTDFLATSHFAPKIADIRERLAKRAGIAPSGMEAWGLVLKALHSGYGVPRWDAALGDSRLRPIPWPHPAIGLALDDLGGIVAATSWETTDLPAHRARFEQAYSCRLANGKDTAAQTTTDRVLSADELRTLGGLGTTGIGAMPGQAQRLGHSANDRRVT